jgi:1-acyl-sn-glycerol-3-phosphate acyltransferase
MPRLWRLPTLVLLLAAGLVVEAVLFPFAPSRLRRRAIRVWSHALVSACGVAIDCDPALAAAADGRLIVANHVSWLDIFAINAATPSAFVAKAEIRRWPVLGLLVAAAGTVFIERSRRHAVHQAIERLRERMRAGWPAAVFPEATTSDGRCLLPFYANLIQVACNDGLDVLVVGLRYRGPDDQWPEAMTYVGDTTFMASLWRVTGARSLRVDVGLIETMASAGRTRHELAARARVALSRWLALPLADSSPGTVLRSRA